LEHHKPRAVHNWRELLNEIGVIVISVLIALSAEQAVETLHWRHEVEQGREAVRENLAAVLGLIEERAAVAPCLERRLDAVQAVIEQGAESGRLPPLGPLGAPPSRPWRVSSWPSLVSSQISSHFPRDELINLGLMAASIDYVDELGRREQADWAMLYQLVGPGRRFSDAEQASLRAALSDARHTSGVIAATSGQLGRIIRGRNILTAAQLADTEERAKTARAAMADQAVCKPIGPAPARYGAAISGPDNAGRDGLRS
jgi:hypothetical protein